MSDTLKTAKELILRRRRQMLVHSCIYYQLDENIISDDTWQKWANELAELQTEYGYRFKFYDREFSMWDGTSGAFLPLKDEWVLFKAKQLLKMHSKKC